MKRIEGNLKFLKQYFLNALSVLFTILSAVLLLLDKETIGIDSQSKAILTFAAMILAAIVYAILQTCFYKRKDIFSNGNGKLVVEYGDLWKIAFPSTPFLEKDSKKIVVVSVNTAFDTIVDEDNLDKIQKPLVSAKSMHGQWIKKMQKCGADSEKLNQAIQDNLRCQGIQPVKELNRSQKERGNLACYEKGTIAVYTYNSTIFYLLALSEFDENNNAQNTREELNKTIGDLAEYYDKCGQGYELYLPLLGPGLSRTEITPAESLQTMVSYFKMHRSEIHGNIKIIVYEKLRDEVSLDV